MVEKFPMEEEEIFFFILNLKMWGFLTYMQNCTEKGPRGYFLGPLWSTLGSNGGCNCNCNNTVWFEMVQCSSSASDIERCFGSAQSQSVVCFGTVKGNADEIRH